jgi:hypothetical protein
VGGGTVRYIELQIGIRGAEKIRATLLSLHLWVFGEVLVGGIIGGRGESLVSGTRGGHERGWRGGRGAEEARARNYAREDLNLTSEHCLIRAEA